MGDSMDVDPNGPNSMEVDMHDGIGSLRVERATPSIGRRGSMSHEEERQRRASIKAILADESITPQERRRSIQLLMDGRRSSIGTASVSSSAASGDLVDNSNSNFYGYGDESPYGYGDAGPTSCRDDNGHLDYRGHHIVYADSDGAHCIPISNENTKRAELTRPPCTHYERNCTVVAPCCGAAFGCRICHDDSPILPPLLIAKKASRRYPRSSSLPGGFTSMDPQLPEDTHHAIDRFKIKEVICRECYTKQSSKT
jgi:hypothetical protein